MENKIKSEEKIVKAAKGLKIASKVLYALVSAACLTFIVLAIVLPLTKGMKGYTNTETCLIFVGLALYSFFLIGVIWNVEQVFVSIEREKSPFSSSITRYIKKTGCFVALVSLIPALIQNVLVAILAKDSDVNSVIQVGGIISGVVLYLLGYFFEYGEELKRKDDQIL